MIENTYAVLAVTFVVVILYFIFRFILAKDVNDDDTPLPNSWVVMPSLGVLGVLLLLSSGWALQLMPLAGMVVVLGIENRNFNQLLSDEKLRRCQQEEYKTEARDLNRHLQNKLDEANNSLNKAVGSNGELSGAEKFIIEHFASDVGRSPIGGPIGTVNVVEYDDFADLARNIHMFTAPSICSVGKGVNAAQRYFAIFSNGSIFELSKKEFEKYEATKDSADA